MKWSDRVTVARWGRRMPEVETVVRAIEGDPLAKIELGEYTEHCRRSNRMWRRLLLLSILVNVGILAFNLATVDGGLDWLVIVFQLVFLPLIVFSWYTGSDRYRASHPPAGL